ncbi:MAG: hypothetical protein F9K23_16550 [Bacteroidetes bacterium]|nr:MAG: hypothetical protein F9K23_16550 [Bacteroidota bacterium]
MNYSTSPSPKREGWLGRAQAFPLDRVKPHIHTNRTPSTGSGWATALARRWVKSPLGDLGVVAYLTRRARMVELLNFALS